MHMDYVIAASNLKAVCYAIKGLLSRWECGVEWCDVVNAGTKDRDAIKRIVEAVKVHEFVPRSGVRIATTDAEAESLGSQSGESEVTGAVVCI